MNATRRSFLSASLAGAAGLTLGAPALARLLRQPPAPATPATFFTWKKAREGAHVALEGGGNALWLATKEGAILVDCKNAGFGAVLRSEGETLATPLAQAINTHHHGDHTGGNHAVVGSVPVTAHARCRDRVAGQTERYISQVKEGILNLSGSSSPAADKVRAEIKKLHDRLAGLKAEDWTPTRTLASEHEEIKLGGVTLHLHHFGPGHTDNDVVVHIPDLNLIHAGDLLFHRLHPFMDPNGGATTTGWQKSLDGVIGLCKDDTVVIPGHGELADVAGVRAQRDYFDTLRRIVRYAKDNDGMTRDQVKALKTGAFEGLGNERFLPNTLTFVYDELARPGAG